VVYREVFFGKTHDWPIITDSRLQKKEKGTIMPLKQQLKEICS